MKLDEFTKQHMVKWAKRYFSMTWEVRCAAVVTWMESLDEDQFVYYLNAGWESTFKAAQQYENAI